MNLSDKAKQHVDSCRFCWMCHHICPIGNATGHERSTARARALGISLVNRNAIELSEIMDNIYECCTCGGCVNVCVTGWDPVMFKKAIESHSAKTDTLLYLGVDARYKVSCQAVKAIKVLEKAGAEFTVLCDEPASGSQLDFLISAADETKKQMEAAAKVFADYKTVVLYDPNDAKTVKQLYKEYGIEVKANAVTYTSFVAGLLKDGKLKAHNTGKTVVFQDPYQLSRDLEETEEPREIIKAYATLHEMLLNRRETVWAGNILMAEYLPEVIKEVAARRLYNVESIHEDTVVTACVSEYAALKSVKQDKITVLSIEDLILG